MFGLLVVLTFASWNLAEPVMEKNPGLVLAILAVAVMALLMSLFMLAGMLLFQAVVVLFAQKEGVVCEHTVTLTDEGLFEETDVNRSLHKYPVVERPYRFFGLWVLGVGGAGAFVFRESGLLAGDVAVFSTELERRRRNFSAAVAA